jgi:hypothetical protein
MLLTRLMIVITAILTGLWASQPAGAVPPLEQSREKHFQQLDKNRDGRVSREEFLAPWKANRQIAEEQFRKFDKNGDGFLTPEEYIPRKRPASPQK